MAYEITGQRREPQMMSIEDDPFVAYDAAMEKAYQPFYWVAGFVVLALVGFGALIWGQTR
jgi:hypothetical protein